MTTSDRFVLDTNTIVSALLLPTSIPRQALDRRQAGFRCEQRTMTTRLFVDYKLVMGTAPSGGDASNASPIAAREHPRRSRTTNFYAMCAQFFVLILIVWTGPLRLRKLPSKRLNTSSHTSKTQTRALSGAARNTPRMRVPSTCAKSFLAPAAA